MNILGHYISGRDVQVGVRQLPVIDPANGEVVRIVKLADVEQVDAAIAAASLAFDSWREIPPAPKGNDSDSLQADTGSACSYDRGPHHRRTWEGPRRCNG